jgi:hypothetical protein
MIGSSSHNNRSSDNDNKDKKSRFQRDTRECEELENTSVCSNCSSITTTDHDEDNDDDNEVPAEVETTVCTSASRKAASPFPEKKSKFTITKATARPSSPSSSSPKSDAVSISFLGPIAPESRLRTKPGQVIQKALAGLRPGGIFFVLDYQDDSHIVDASMGISTSTTTKSSGTAGTPNTCSLAVKEIPHDLVQQWNLTIVPTNLETFYNTKLKQVATKPAPTRGPSLVPASRRIVRWMGIKPRQQVSPKE